MSHAPSAPWAAWQRALTTHGRRASAPGERGAPWSRVMRSEPGFDRRTATRAAPSGPGQRVRRADAHAGALDAVHAPAVALGHRHGEARPAARHDVRGRHAHPQPRVARPGRRSAARCARSRRWASRRRARTATAASAALLRARRGHRGPPTRPPRRAARARARGAWRRSRRPTTAAARRRPGRRATGARGRRPRPSRPTGGTAPAKPPDRAQRARAHRARSPRCRRPAGRRPLDVHSSLPPGLTSAHIALGMSAGSSADGVAQLQRRRVGDADRAAPAGVAAVGLRRGRSTPAAAAGARPRARPHSDRRSFEALRHKISRPAHQSSPRFWARHVRFRIRPDD